uniref:ubiquitinyl hydrolase 1 n=1 Tax=Taeniopygia guttata TaxID=59729 RepID=A0A674G9I3_TAEGU
MKGLALSNSEVIRQVHNSFARQQMFEFDAKSSAKEEDAFHFVSYVPVNGRLYELDGLREGPIDLGACHQDDWISAVRPVIEKRIQKYSEGEIRFNLMAIVSDRKMIYEQRIAELQQQLAQEEPMDTDQSSNMLSSIQSEVAKYQMLIEEENQKLKRYKIENIRRKHNYLPFIMELLKTLAEHQQLIPLVEKVSIAHVIYFYFFCLFFQVLWPGTAPCSPVAAVAQCWELGPSLVPATVLVYWLGFPLSKVSSH